MIGPHVCSLLSALHPLLCHTTAQGSRWTLQAVRMNGQLGQLQIQPDQMQALNPILILVFIPIFEIIIYPLFAKCHLFKRCVGLYTFRHFPQTVAPTYLPVHSHIYHISLLCNCIPVATIQSLATYDGCHVMAPSRGLNSVVCQELNHTYT